MYRRILNSLLVLSLWFLIGTTTIHAETYYISPTGNDSNSGLTTQQPWQTFTRSWRDLYPGDTLILMDGVYTETLTPTERNGTAEQPITIRAQHDGMAIIDGEGIRETVRLEHWGAGPIGSYYVIEGIVARNSSGSVFQINFDNNVLRRVSGYDAYTDGNEHVFTISANNTLIEDCVAAGSGRKMIVIFQGSNNTIRRCFAHWQSWDGREWHDAWPWGDNIQIYNASDNIIENSIAFGSAPLWGISIQANGPEAISSNNKILGSMAINGGMNIDGTPVEWGNTRPQPSEYTEIRDFNWPNQRAGFMFLTINELSNNLVQDVVSWGNAGLGLSTLNNGGMAENNRLVRATLINNGLDNPDQYGGKGTEVFANELDMFTVSDSLIEGSSQHIGGGAQLLHRYVDGELTNALLWPWPMEARIQGELNISVNALAAGILPEQIDLDNLPTLPFATPTPSPTPTVVLRETPTSSPKLTPGATPTPTATPQPLPTSTPIPSPTVGSLMPPPTPTSGGERSDESFLPFVASSAPY